MFSVHCFTTFRGFPLFLWVTAMTEKSEKDVSASSSDAPRADFGDLYSRMNAERGTGPDSHFNQADANQDGVLAKHELAAGAQNPDILPTQREFLQLLHDNFDVVTKLQGDDKGGVTPLGESILQDLTILREGYRMSMVPTAQIAADKFEQFDADGDGFIDQKDLHKVFLADKEAKVYDPYVGLSKNELVVMNNLNILLGAKQTETDSKFLMGRVEASFSRRELTELTADKAVDLAMQSALRPRYDKYYAKPSWETLIAGGVGGAIGFYFGREKGGVAGGWLGYTAGRKFDERNKDYYAAQDSVSLYKDLKGNGMDAMFDKLMVATAVKPAAPAAPAETPKTPADAPIGSGMPTASAKPDDSQPRQSIRDKYKYLYESK